MKMHSGSILLGVLAIFAGAATGVRVHLEREGCSRGAAVLGVFYENPCQRSQPEDPFPKLRVSPGQLFPLPLTVNGLRNYLTNYCRMAMPQIRRCFARHLEVCDASQQNYLNALARNTSVICEANSTHISAWMTFLLSRLTDEQLAFSGQCTHNDQALLTDCKSHAAEVSGLMFVDPDELQTAPVDDQLPMINSYFSTLTQCRIQAIRDDPSRCPDWRMWALEVVLPLTGPPILGINFRLSQAQVTDLFELNE